MPEFIDDIGGEFGHCYAYGIRHYKCILFISEVSTMSKDKLVVVLTVFGALVCWFVGLSLSI